MIRILQVVSSLGTGSGVMSALMSYHRHMDRSQIQFDYLSFRDTEHTFEAEIRSLGGRVFHFPNPARLAEFRKKADSFFRERSGEYAIIHCHPIYGFLFVAPSAKRYGIRHIIQHSHTTQFSGKPWSALRNRVILMLFGGMITDFAACSQEAKQIFSWVDPSQVFVMRNAFDPEKFAFSPRRRAQIRRQYGIGDHTLLLGHVGRFSKEKNHPFLLEILTQLKESGEHVKLLLLGDGSCMEKVQNDAAQRGLSDAVIFAGRQDDVAGYLSSMDVFLFPSKFEGLGIALLEAQVNGLPAIASDVVPGETKISGLVEYKSLGDSARSWADAACRKKRDPRVSVDAKQYDIRLAAEELLKYYQGLA